MALFAGSTEIEEVGRIIGAASFSRVRVKARQIIGIEELVKDIVANAGPFWFFVRLPDVVVTLTT